LSGWPRGQYNCPDGADAVRAFTALCGTVGKRACVTSWCQSAGHGRCSPVRPSVARSMCFGSGSGPTADAVATARCWLGAPQHTKGGLCECINEVGALWPGCKPQLVLFTGLAHDGNERSMLHTAGTQGLHTHIYIYRHTSNGCAMARGVGHMERGLQSLGAHLPFTACRYGPVCFCMCLFMLVYASACIVH
jgi:hypothetical protein